MFKRILILSVMVLSTILTVLPITPVYAANETLTVDAEGAQTSGSYVPTGFLAGWTYQKVFQIRHSPDGALTNYQLPLHVYFGAGVDGEETINGVVGGKVYINGLSQADFDDIRVTKIDGTSLLDIWLESKVDGVGAYFWIEFDAIPASTDDNWFCLYYGNVGAVSVSNGANTFSIANNHFFDDFERGVNGDTIGGSWTEDVAHVHISTDTAYTGTRSGKWIGGTSPVAHIALLDSANIAYYYRVYKETADVFDIRQGNGVNQLRVDNPAANEIYEWYNGAIYTDTSPAVSIVPDSWDYTNIYGFNFNTSVATINNSSNTAALTMFASAASNDQMTITGSAGAGNDTYFDNFIVRNWTTNTPRFGTWSEQATSATKWHYLNSDDGNGTYLNVVGTSTIPLSHSYSFSAATATAISGITMYYAVAYASAGSAAIRPYAYIGTSTYYSTSVTATSTSQTLYACTWTTNPATGEAWTLTTISAANFGLEFQGTYRWNYVKMVITYAAATLPTVLTVAASNITLTSATFNGNVTNYGSTNIDQRGFVWDTTSHINPGNVDHALTVYANNFVEVGTWTTGAFNYSAAPLLANTLYYVRACAHNSSGWVYGEELTFYTVATITVTLLEQTNVSTASAQLNAVITFDGNQLCDARFGWGLVTQAANADLYTFHSDWVNDTYDSLYNNHPAYIITSLSASTTYFFNVQVRNDYGTVQGVELSFTTPAAGLDAPTNFTAKPESNAINIAWTKDTDATGVLVRYSLAAYPATTTSGIEAYRGTSGSYRLAGLNSGFTYYFSAWCYANGTYSASYVNIMGTTWAYNTLDEPASTGTVSHWFVEANDAALQKIPGHQLVNGVATTYSIPQTTMWFIVGIFISVAFGAFIYSISNNPNIAVIAVVIGMFGGVMAGIFSGWMIFVIVILSVGMIAVAART